MKKLRGLLCAMAFVLGTVGVSATGLGATFLAIVDGTGELRELCIEANLYTAEEHLQAVYNLSGGKAALQKAGVGSEDVTCADVGM